MIRVGFLLNFPVEYKGGINYFKNLFYAVNKFYKEDIQIVIFIPSNLSEEYISIFDEYACIVKTKILQRKSIFWYISKVSDRIIKFDPLIYLLLKNHKINVISHSNYVFPGKQIKSINWIPDFQYLHYPHLWTKRQLANEYKLHKNLIEKSFSIVVSSYDAKKDFESVCPEYIKKVRVLHFVSQPDILKHKTVDITKYVSGDYFYMPNQFWEHKNHLTVFKAVKILKNKGNDVKVLTSGLMNDYRNKNKHISELQNFVNTNNLIDNIKFLGLIPYSEVLQLIKMSKAVINPSFFEGWSSTVEESKSIGKTVILSDIPVHREQNPINGYFFNPNDENELANIMIKLLTIKEKQITSNVENELLIDLEVRTKEFAQRYLTILKEVCS